MEKNVINIKTLKAKPRRYTARNESEHEDPLLD